MTSDRYSRLAVFLHWSIALALAFQFALGWQMNAVAQGQGRFVLFQLHKSVGIAILVLSLVRLAWRMAHRPPARLTDGRVARGLASTVTAGFYIVMIGAPLAGWALVSTARIGVPTRIFGIISLPHLPLPASINPAAVFAHQALAYLGIALFALHVAGALRHQFLKGEDLIARMLPRRLSGRPVAAFAIALAAITGAALSGLTAGGAQRPSPVAARSPAPLAPAQPLLAAVRPDSPVKQAPSAVEAAQRPIALPLRDWVIAPGGKLSFTAQWQDNPIVGTFPNWSARIRFSPDAPGQSGIDADVDLLSVSTSDGQRDEMLRGDDFFSTAAHPTAHFRATHMIDLGNGRYSAPGTLSLRGVARPVTLRFTIDLDGDRASVRGGAELDRTAFGIGTGEWASTQAIPATVAIDFAFNAAVANAGRAATR